ncbi:MAG: response regulator, partial [Oscillospiraceae bacterium]|nr:response regulator [Oscillospiraceae bacterium]
MDVRDTLLLVNDNSSSRAALQSIFEPNYNLLEAENGEQALLLMEENHRCIAAVLLDTVMPIKDGYQVLTEMGQRELLNELPVIILTDETNPDIESKAFDLGASEVITAPYDLYCVQRRVQNIIQLNRKRWRLEIALEKQSALPLHAHEIMVDTLTSLIESRDLQSGHHVSRVRYLTQVLLQEVARSCPEYGLTPEQIRLISSAATFHDIGKITLSDALLTKPGPLTPEETAIMQNHTLAGCRVLEGMGYIGDDTYLRYAYNICRYHHERWDGCGYPEGLKGDAIPICAQVVGMVDAYDALTSNSAHKTAYPHALAINMILNGECGMFSPKLLECLKQISVQFLDAPAANTSSQPQTTEKITDPLPGPLPQQGLDTPQSVQLKYQALLQHLDATVLEADLDNNLCHL